jgi:hypothetical protein
MAIIILAVMTPWARPSKNISMAVLALQVEW